jgi:hypothetical protein
MGFTFFSCQALFSAPDSSRRKASADMDVSIDPDGACSTGTDSDIEVRIDLADSFIYVFIYVFLRNSPLSTPFLAVCLFQVFVIQPKLNATKYHIQTL